ncbi:MAG: aconitase X catalytic domain-containing protein [Thermoplasmata archaeon]
MYLTPEEEKIFDGEYGEAKKIAIRLLYSLGELGGANGLITIKSAHVSGVSYKNIGEGGLKFLRKISDRVSVPTSINPLGFDLTEDGPVEIDDNFRKKQLEVVKIYQDMGIMNSYTCTPYYFYNEPEFGDHLAWAESSAITYANSILGARTNRESGPSALSAAIIGKTPDHGMHRIENRYAEIIIKPHKLLDYSEMAALGLYTGYNGRGKIPLIKGQNRLKSFEIKAFAAAFGAASSVPMFHVDGVTPESNLVREKAETIEVENSDIWNIMDKFSGEEPPELIAIGCPHLSVEELNYIAGLVRGKKKTGPDFFLFTNRRVKEEARDAVRDIENFGGKVFVDTCMVVSPLSNKYHKTATNSGKASFYLPLKEYGNQEVTFKGIMQLIKWVIA